MTTTPGTLKSQLLIHISPHSIFVTDKVHRIQATPTMQVCPGKFNACPLYTCKALRDIKIYATRRRRVNYMQSETYVYIEPGKKEEFISEEELKERLKGWLENWPNKALPPDLARFETLDEAVTYLVKSVCELEIDGDVGAIQWYEIRLE